MARAPSFDFERRERQKAKAAKKAEKAKAKTERKNAAPSDAVQDAESGDAASEPVGATS